ncbi:polyprenyl synthetase family protein [Streptomyces griseoviridis]|uniref:Polyprenyl synthetase n=1 Tax=Streptomyces griseoviridis TaxID=45398 RepID=A0A3S9Z625_STRGD|nr:polyprenyl synthetase family protein [Streptomyces griseoviridis]AZS83119.1 polyprenyl synthetase family protein [Streptomyces griseoviridis]QCN90024.1 polyprenyl synthetase [Streptomyces griseoviridis]
MASDRWASADFKSRVDEVLRRFVAEEADHLIAIDGSLEPVAAQLEAAVSDGKRLRAAFCYWGWRAVGQPDNHALLRAVASMELVHAAAVVHDDLIDDSPMRHGRPTAQVALRDAAGPHPRSVGAARSLALLVGDLLMALAGQLFATCGLPAAYLARARPLWSALARELIAGECLEILRTGTAPDTGQSLKVIRYKTAKYTVEQPLLIGGTLAGAGGALLDGYSAYGLPLGEAFQLRDDLLGLFGDPAHTGKANSDDVRGRRPTVLLAETWRMADTEDRARLHRLLGRGAPTGDTLESVREMMVRLRAPERVEGMILARVREALDALHGLDVPAHAEAALTALAHSAADRAT